MKIWKLFGVSIAAGLGISYLSSRFFSSIGEYFAVPGIVLESWLNLIIVSFADNPKYGLVDTYVYLNVLFYSVATFSLLLLLQSRQPNE